MRNLTLAKRLPLLMGCMAALLGSSAFLLSCEDDPTAPSGATATGSVLGVDGSPLAGVQVTIYIDSTSYSATTGSQGEFSVTSLPAGTAAFKFFKVGYVPSWRHRTLVTGDTVVVAPLLKAMSTFQTFTVPGPLDAAVHMAEGEAEVVIPPGSLVIDGTTTAAVGTAEISITPFPTAERRQGIYPAEGRTADGYLSGTLAISYVVIQQGTTRLQPKTGAPLELIMQVDPTTVPGTGTLAEQHLFYLNPTSGLWDDWGTVSSADTSTNKLTSQLPHLCGYCYGPPPPPPPPEPCSTLAAGTISGTVKDAYGNGVAAAVTATDGTYTHGNSSTSNGAYALSVVFGTPTNPPACNNVPSSFTTVSWVVTPGPTVNIPHQVLAPTQTVTVSTGGSKTADLQFKIINNAACSASSQCLSNNCVDGLCLPST